MAMFQKEVKDIRGPVGVSGGEKPGALMGQAAMTSAQANANLITAVGTQAVKADVGRTEAKVEEVTTDIMNKTIADNGWMGKDVKEALVPRNIGVVTPASIQAYERGQPHEQVTRLETQMEVLQRAKEQGVLSGTEANARIDAAVKEAIARWPGLADQFRKTAVTQVEATMYGDKQVYNMLVDSQKNAAADKQKQKEQDTIRQMMFDYNISDPQVAYQMYVSDNALKRESENATRVLTSTNVKADLVEYPLFVKTVAPDRNVVRQSALSLGRKYAGMGATAENDVNAKQEIKQLQASIEGQKRAEISTLESMVATGKLTPEKAKTFRASIDEEYKSISEAATNVTKLVGFADYADTIAKQGDLIRNKVALMNPLSSYFSNKQDEAIAYRTVVKNLLANGLDPSAPDSSLTPEQVKKRNSFLAAQGIVPEKWNMYRNLATLEASGQGNDELMRLYKFDSETQQEDVKTIQAKSATGDPRYKTKWDELVLQGTKLSADSPLTEENVKKAHAFALESVKGLEAFTTATDAGVKQSPSYKTTQDLFKVMPFVDKLPKEAQQVFYSQVLKNSMTALFSSEKGSVASTLEQLGRPTEQGIIFSGGASSYVKQFDMKFDPVTKQVEFVRKGKGSAVASLVEDAGDVERRQFIMKVQRDVNALIALTNTANNKLGNTGIDINNLGMKLEAVFESGYGRTEGGFKSDYLEGLRIPTPEAAKKSDGNTPIEKNNPLGYGYKEGVKNSHASFSSMEDAFDTYGTQFERYIARGTATVEEGLSKWTGLSGEKLQPYLATVQKKGGVSPTDPLTVDVLPKLLYGMQYAEQSKEFLTEEQIKLAMGV